MAFNSRLAFNQQPAKRNPSAICMRRIQSELKSLFTSTSSTRLIVLHGTSNRSELNDWMAHPPDGCLLDTFDPLLSWTIQMQGPETAPAPGLPRLYENEVFRLAVNFTDRYPMEPPEFFFIPPSPVHPHIYSNGHTCLDILYDGHNGGWSPALTINKVCLSLRSMLASNTDKRRPPGDQQYCVRMNGRSPKETRWEFEDDKV